MKETTCFTCRKRKRLESELLDRRRIINVAIAEPPTVPSLPSNQRYLTVLSGGFFAIFVSIGMAFLAEQADRTFRTPDEVRSFLDIPVFASLPQNNNNGSGGHNGESTSPQKITTTETYVS